MKVYVVTNPEDGWDCVRGVFSSVEKLAKYFTERKISFKNENSDWVIKDFTGLSLDEIDEFLSENNFSYVTHEKILV